MYPKRAKLETIGKGAQKPLTTTAIIPITGLIFLSEYRTYQSLLSHKLILHRPEKL